MLKLKVILTSFFVLLGVSAFCGDLFIEAGTPVFVKPEIGSKLIAVQEEGAVLTYTDSALFILRKHPFGRPFRFYNVEYGRQKNGLGVSFFAFCQKKRTTVY